MRNLVVTCIAALVVAFSDTTAQSVPNFTGDWGLDQAKSTLPPEMAQFKDIVFLVKQEAKQIRVLRQMISDPAAMRRGESVVVGPLDYVTYKFGGGGKLQARWATAGNVLELLTTAKDRSTRTEQWQASADGQVLTVTDRRQDSGGPHEYNLVLAKLAKKR